MLTIHGVPISVHARKVVVAARLKGLAHRVEPVIPFRPPEGWADKSPTGLIPAIDDDGFTLADSTAICLYLEAKHPQAPLLPKDPRALGRVMWFDAYAGGTVFRTFLHGLFGNLVIKPKVLGEPGDDAEVARLLAEVAPKLLGYLESQAGAGYIVGERLTLADIALASNLINYRYLGFAVDAARYPKLAAYAARMIAEPVIAAVLADERPFAQQMGLELDWLEARQAA